MSPRGKAFMAVTLALALAGHWGWRLLSPRSPLGEERWLATIFPEADGFSPKQGTPPRYTAFGRGTDGVRRPIGVAWLTSDVLPRERGYAGPIHILAGMRNDGRIAAIRVVSHQETPSYTGALQDPVFLERYTGKKPGDGFIPDRDVDGITRATITAEAVARAVRDSSRIVAREALRLDVPPPEGARAALPWLRLALLALGAAGALASFLLPRAPLRGPVLAWSLAVLGFWLGAYLSLGQMAALLLGRPAPLLAHLDWYLLLAVALVSAFTVGNLYCARICPFGALQDLVAWLAGKAGAGPRPRTGTREASVLRPVYLWLTLMAAFSLGMADAAGYEPFAIAFDRKGGWLAAALLAAVLAGSCLFRRFWCRVFCPVGWVLEACAGRKRRPRSTADPRGPGAV